MKKRVIAVLTMTVCLLFSGCAGSGDNTTLYRAVKTTAKQILPKIHRQTSALIRSLILRKKPFSSTADMRCRF